MAAEVSVTTTHAVVALLGSVVVLWLWRSSVRRKRERAAAESVRAGVRLFSLTGRTVVGALLIAGVQWLALTHPASTPLIKAGVLVVPALVGSWVVVRALTVTALDDHRSGRRGRRGGRR